MGPLRCVTGEIRYNSVTVVIWVACEVACSEPGQFRSLILNEYMTHLMDKMPSVKTLNSNPCKMISCRQKAFRVAINNPFFFYI